MTECHLAVRRHVHTRIVGPTMADRACHPFDVGGVDPSSAERNLSDDATHGCYRVACGTKDGERITGAPLELDGRAVKRSELGDVLPNSRVPIEPTLRLHECRLAEPVPEVWIGIQQGELLGHRHMVTRRDQIAISGATDDLARTPNVGCNDRLAQERGLDD